LDRRSLHPSCLHRPFRLGSTWAPSKRAIRPPRDQFQAMGWVGGQGSHLSSAAWAVWTASRRAQMRDWTPSSKRKRSISVFMSRGLHPHTHAIHMKFSGLLGKHHGWSSYFRMCAHMARRKHFHLSGWGCKRDSSYQSSTSRTALHQFATK
jgi:hypothetical protein